MNVESGHEHFYLASLLAPLTPWLERLDVTDIYINRPAEIWVEQLSGSIKRIEVPALTARELDRLARQVAAFSHQGVSRTHPLLAASLPDGSRVQIALPPATRGGIAIAIRRHVASDMSLSDYAAQGAFPSADAISELDARNAELVRLHQGGEFEELLRTAVRQRRNILVSGGTSSGKTTFLNALLREIPEDERLLFIEDTPELKIRHTNTVGMIAVRGEQGETQVSADDLLVASLRMRPDRIILGEIRGGEAMTFLRAVNTGHPGSMTTIHADSPERAVQQLALLVLQRGTKLRRDDVVDYVWSVIDLFVQVERSGVGRRVSQIRLNLTGLCQPNGRDGAGK